MQVSTNTSINQNYTINIFIVDDHPFLVEGLQLVINKHPNFHVCGYATSIQETLQKIKSCNPNILVADIQIKDESGIQLIKEVRKILPNIKILMISMHNEPYYIEQSIQEGAQGYIIKSESTDLLMIAINTIHSGEKYLSPSVEKKLLNKVLEPNQKVLSQFNIDILTGREQEILQLYGKGKSTKFISNLLNISPRTVDAHKEHIRQKLNKKSMKEVLEMAIEWTKLISVPHKNNKR